jgi:enoyl-CoA hydratase/carnithine racemase
MTETPLILIEQRGPAGLITLNRPKALNALSLGMIRDITAALLAWKVTVHIKLVAIRGMGKDKVGNFASFGAFCAGVATSPKGKRLWPWPWAAHATNSP